MTVPHAIECDTTDREQDEKQSSKDDYDTQRWAKWLIGQMVHIIHDVFEGRLF